MNDEKILEKNQVNASEEVKEQVTTEEVAIETVSSIQQDIENIVEEISAESNVEVNEEQPVINQDNSVVELVSTLDENVVTEEEEVNKVDEDALNPVPEVSQVDAETMDYQEEKVSDEPEKIVVEETIETEAIDYSKEYEKTLNRIYKDVISGKSLTSIANQLNEEQVVDQEGNLFNWTEDYIKNQLKNINSIKKSEKKILENVLKEQKEENIAKETKPQETTPKPKKEKDNKKKIKNKKISKSAKRTRMIILAVLLYVDAIFAFIFLTKGYLTSFLGGISSFSYNLLNNATFTTAVLLIVVFLITNGVAIGLYKDAKNTKRKKADNYSPIIDETDSIDGRVEVEEEVEEEEIEEVKAPVYRNSKTIESINIKKVQEDLIDAALEVGVVIDKKTARDVLAAIAGGQLIFVKEPEMDLCKKFLRCLSKFFGVEYYETTVKDNASSFEAIMKTYQGTSATLTPFSKSVMAANRLIESVNLSVLTNVDPANMMDYFKDVFGQAKNPNLKNEVKIGTRQSTSAMYDIPKNFWTICCLKDEESVIPSEIAKYSFFIDLHLKEADEVKEPVDRKAISYPQLVDCYSELFEMCYIEEDVWKHLDEFEEYLSARGPYFVDNRIIRQMERFAAIYLALDGEQADVVDALLVSKLLLIALPNTYKKLDNSEETIVGTAEKILGADYIMNCQELLKKIKMI